MPVPQTPGDWVIRRLGDLGLVVMIAVLLDWIVT